MALFKSSKTPKMIIGVLLALMFVWALNKYVIHGSKNVGKSQTLSAGQLATTSEVVGKTTDNHPPLPEFNSPANKGTRIDIWGMAWNGQMGMAYAMGGSQTSKGSLMDQHGIDAKFVWQDDCNKTVAAFIANANDIKNDINTVPIVMVVMGDGMPGFTAAMKDLEKLGKDYKPIVFHFAGRSDGEDGFWGPKEWKANPKNCLGKCVAAVARDGDANIVLKWAADNGIPINVNNKYIDRDALNLQDASDYVEAGNKYITGYVEKRIVVRNGKTYPDSVIECPTDAYTSWTPVDVTVAEKKGGLVRLASTHEYTAQMPTTLVVCKAWAYGSSEHQTALKNLIKAISMGGDQVRSFPDALDFAGKVEAIWFGDQKDKPGPYWVKYYKGVEEKDATGMRVSLGGSKAFNLADAANMIGKGKDGVDRYKMTYNYFGGQLQKLYPKEMEGMMQYSDLVDKSFISHVLDNNDDLKNEVSEVEQQTYASAESGGITNEVSNKIYNINFNLGSAVVKPASYEDLNEIAQSAIISEGLSIGVYGHTDNIGNPQSNQTLSEQRANSVAQYLMQKGVPAKRITIIGYGDTRPVNGTDASNPVNRCVEIVQGN